MSYPLLIRQAIKSEILTDPVAVGYAGKTPMEQARLMAAPRQQSPRVFTRLSVSPQSIALILIKAGKWKAVVDAANTPATPGHNDAFKLVELSRLASVVESFEGPELKAIVASLVTAGLITDVERDAIRDISRIEEKLSRLQVLGLDTVTKDDIVEALAS